MAEASRLTPNARGTATSRSSGGAPTPANGELFIFARVGWGRLRLYHSYLGLGFALFRSPRLTLTRCLTVDPTQ